MLCNQEDRRSTTSFIKPQEIINLYHSNRLLEYIETCILDKRSPSFIEKMKALDNLCLNEIQARAYIKNALNLETKIVNNSTSRQRINRKEMFGYLIIKDIDSCIKHYNNVHGTPDGFRTDMEFLINHWNEYDNSKNLEQFNRIINKYQNKRNQN